MLFIVADSVLTQVDNALAILNSKEKYIYVDPSCVAHSWGHADYTDFHYFKNLVLKCCLPWCAANFHFLIPYYRCGDL